MNMDNEPVAWMVEVKNDIEIFFRNEWAEKHASLHKVNAIPLYTHPAKTLTDEEIEGIAKANVDGHSSMEQLKWFAKAILRKAQEK